LCDLSAEWLRLHVVGANDLAVDLDDRDALAVARLELLVACDVDLAQLEAELVLQLVELGPREVAQVAALRAVEGDFYGYSPRVVVASATRWTAIPYAARRMVVPRA
jgi:hypothetical protein